MAGRPITRYRRTVAAMNPLEWDTSRAAPMKKMKEKWLDVDLGPWLPGNRNRLTETGAKLRARVLAIMPDENNRFTLDHVTPEVGTFKILLSSEAAGPDSLKGVNFWHRLFDQPGGQWFLVPEGLSGEDLQEYVMDLNAMMMAYAKPSRETWGRLVNSAWAKRAGIRSQYDVELFPVVRTNIRNWNWTTSQDIEADQAASVLGFVRGLKLSVLHPHTIYDVNLLRKAGLSHSEIERRLNRPIPTEAEEAELREILLPVEQLQERMIQYYFERAAAAGLVLLWEQPNAQISAAFGGDATYESSKSAINKLLKRAVPPKGYRFSWQR